MQVAERVLSPLDAVRAALLRRLGRTAGWWSRSREDRVASMFAFGIVTSLTLAVLAPRWTLALGPIVLGVPHVLADARYLVVRPGYHRRSAILLAVLPPLAAGLWTADLAWAAVAMAAATLVARGPLLRKVVALAAAAALYAACAYFGRLSAIVFAHLHNFIAIGLWWSLRPRRRELFPLALYVVACLAIALGTLDFAFEALRLPAIGTSLRGHGRDLAPASFPADLAVRAAVFFAFAQSIHYVVWLRLIPEDGRERTAPRPFISTFRALMKDLGPWALAAFALGAAVILGWAFVDLADARSGYLRMAVVHGHLELAALALFFVEGVPTRAPGYGAPATGSEGRSETATT